MATRRPPAQQPTTISLELRISREDAKSKLQTRIEKGLELKQRHTDTKDSLETLSNDYSKWDSFNSELLRRLFTTEELAKEYDFWGAMAMSMYESSLSEKIAEVYKDINKKIHRLESIIERLELIPLCPGDANGASATKKSSSPQSPNNRIFIVHGRDDLAKTETARFVEKLGFTAIILHEQPSAGKTIIEKIEEHTEVGFAIALYTACDEGGLAGTSAQKSRARQNVVFEHGYLIAKLGRHNVCALVKGDIEIPNDISGVVYIPMDDPGAWHIALAKELRKAGYFVDMNSVI